jgi:uncharacterized damage-inducible protein DinB
MSASTQLLADAFRRIEEAVHDVLDDIDPNYIAPQLGGRANSIAWLVWHLTRIQDDHVSDVAGVDQAWIAQGWVDRFGLPFSRRATGYGQLPHQVAAVGSVPVDLLLGYYDAVHARTIDYVSGLDDDDLDRVVDTAWTPPVTLGVRLVSVLADDLQHVGQAAFLRGVLERAEGDESGTPASG